MASHARWTVTETYRSIGFRSRPRLAASFALPSRHAVSVTAWTISAPPVPQTATSSTRIVTSCARRPATSRSGVRRRPQRSAIQRLPVPRRPPRPMTCRRCQQGCRRASTVLDLRGRPGDVRTRTRRRGVQRSRRTAGDQPRSRSQAQPNLGDSPGHSCPDARSGSLSRQVSSRERTAHPNISPVVGSRRHGLRPANASSLAHPESSSCRGHRSGGRVAPTIAHCRSRSAVLSVSGLFRSEIRNLLSNQLFTWSEILSTFPTTRGVTVVGGPCAVGPFQERGTET